MRFINVVSGVFTLIINAKPLYKYHKLKREKSSFKNNKSKNNKHDINSHLKEDKQKKNARTHERKKENIKKRDAGLISMN